MEEPEARPASLRADALAAVVLLGAFTVMSLLYAAGVAAIAGLLPAGRPAVPAPHAERSGEGWFHGRPSAAVDGVSGGSNLGPTNPALAEVVTGRVAALRAEHPTHSGPVPVDLVTASGSGFDPHISPAAARLQVRRVAAARRIPEARVRDLVERSIEPRTLGLFGHPRVDVDRLNDRLAELPRDATPATAGDKP